MRKKVLFVAAAMAFFSLTGEGAAEIRLRPVIPLLFAEDSVIESQTNLVRIIHQGRPDAEPALREGAPWELNGDRPSLASRGQTLSGQTLSGLTGTGPLWPLGESKEIFRLSLGCL